MPCRVASLVVPCIVGKQTVCPHTPQPQARRNELPWTGWMGWKERSSLSGGMFKGSHTRERARRQGRSVRATVQPQAPCTPEMVGGVRWRPLGGNVPSQARVSAAALQPQALRGLVLHATSRA